MAWSGSTGAKLPTCRSIQKSFSSARSAIMTSTSRIIVQQLLDDDRRETSVRTVAIPAFRLTSFPSFVDLYPHRTEISRAADLRASWSACRVSADCQRVACAVPSRRNTASIRPRSVGGPADRRSPAGRAYALEARRNIDLQPIPFDKNAEQMRRRASLECVMRCTRAVLIRHRAPNVGLLFPEVSERTEAAILQEGPACSQ